MWQWVRGWLPGGELLTCQVLLQEVLQAEKHHLVELGILPAPALEVRVNFIHVGWILFVVCDLKKQEEKKRESQRGGKEEREGGGMGVERKVFHNYKKPKR